MTTTTTGRRPLPPGYVTRHRDPAGEAAARAVKAERLLAALGPYDMSADDLEHLSDEGWGLAARVAHVRPASDATRAACVAILRHREAEAGRDPFRGLP